MVPMAQLGSLYNPGVPLQIHSEVTSTAPWAARAAPFASPSDANQRGSDFCGALTDGAKTNGTRGEMQRMDIGGNIEAH